MRELSLEFEMKQLGSFPTLLDSGRATPIGTPIPLGSVPGRPSPSARTPTSISGLEVPKEGLRSTELGSAPIRTAEIETLPGSLDEVLIDFGKGGAQATPSRRLTSLKPLPSLALSTLKPADRHTSGLRGQASSGTEPEAWKAESASTSSLYSASGRKPPSGSSLGFCSLPVHNTQTFLPGLCIRVVNLLFQPGGKDHLRNDSFNAV